MFKTINDAPPAKLVPLEVDGHVIHAADGSTLAIALMQAGVHTIRHNHRGEPRAPYCLMGACFECLVQVNGQEQVQSCMVRVESGLRVRLAQGPREVDTP